MLNGDVRSLASVASDPASSGGQKDPNGREAVQRERDAQRNPNWKHTSKLCGVIALMESFRPISSMRAAWDSGGGGGEGRGEDSATIACVLQLVVKTRT
ncbi:hypothetical protein NHX12_021782 [Muraenolepis orangiensis]|uniref:Uncharacterized protein n=1 Tax=Muraenolepis orangiensis TaxID=630683 RepID=A0A9Q0EST1_9TELE|nr:hypothetical protein NHX12_021782 [Muraenolepis orangiensis]